MLSNFGWSHTDEFDAVILRCIESGSVDSAALKVAAEKQERQFKLHDKDQSFRKAWDAYHDSFDDNSDVVLDNLEHAIRTAAAAIDPMNLASTIDFLKEMGRVENARELLDIYVGARDEPPQFWDLSTYPFPEKIKDADVIAAFGRKFQAGVKKRDLAKLLETIGTQGGWGREDMTFLASQDSDDFFKVFKETRGVALRNVIRGALMFRQISNADEDMKIVTKNAEDALRRIGGESPLNARRVKRFGIDVG